MVAFIITMFMQLRCTLAVKGAIHWIFTEPHKKLKNSETNKRKNELSCGKYFYGPECECELKSVYLQSNLGQILSPNVLPEHIMRPTAEMETHRHAWERLTHAVE